MESYEYYMKEAIRQAKKAWKAAKSVMQTSSVSNPGLWWGNTITFHKRTEQPQCVHTPAMLAKTRIRQETTIKIAVKGINHLSHLLKGIFVNARGARQAVGQIMLLKPSPNWNARTAHWRLTPIRSDKGAIMGMVVAACAVPEGTRKLKKNWNR